MSNTVEEILRTYSSDMEWTRTKIENHPDWSEHENDCPVCNKMKQLTASAEEAINQLLIEAKIEALNSAINLTQGVLQIKAMELQLTLKPTTEKEQ